VAELINLRRARKAKSRAEKDRAADASRVKHGVAKSTRDLANARVEKDENMADGHILDRKD
jgi:hypothetical protein